MTRAGAGCAFGPASESAARAATSQQGQQRCSKVGWAPRDLSTAAWRGGWRGGVGCTEPADECRPWTARKPAPAAGETRDPDARRPALSWASPAVWGRRAGAGCNSGEAERLSYLPPAWNGGRGAGWGNDCAARCAGLELRGSDARSGANWLVGRGSETAVMASGTTMARRETLRCRRFSFARGSLRSVSSSSGSDDRCTGASVSSLRESPLVRTVLRRVFLARASLRRVFPSRASYASSVPLPTARCGPFFSPLNPVDLSERLCGLFSRSPCRSVSRGRFGMGGHAPQLQ